MKISKSFVHRASVAIVCGILISSLVAFQAATPQEAPSSTGELKKPDEAVKGSLSPDLPAIHLASHHEVATVPASALDPYIWVSGPVMLLSGEAPVVRVVSVTANVKVGQIQLGVLSGSTVVDITSAEPLIIQAGGFHLDNAAYYAKSLLRQPATPPSGGDPQEYRLTVRPSGDHAWVDVVSKADLEVIVELLE